MIVSITVGDREYELDVVVRGSRYRWDSEVEMPDRAECGTTLACIIAAHANSEGTTLEEAEREIIEECGEAYEVARREDCDDCGDL